MPVRLPRSLALLALLTLALCGPVFAMHHNGTAQRPRTWKRHFRRVRWNPMFRPSHDSLLRQNEEIDRLELPRIADDQELEQLKAKEALVPIRESESLRFDPRLDPARRYCRAWTREFVEDLSQAYYRQFHAQIQVNSAVRTVRVQRRLRRRNSNAAPEKGETASSHLAGVTLDLQRRGMSKAQIRYVESYLFYLKALGLVEPEEERRQWVFHVMVSDRYSDWRQNQTIFPTEHPLPADTALTRAE